MDKRHRHKQTVGSESVDDGVLRGQNEWYLVLRRERGCSTKTATKEKRKKKKKIEHASVIKQFWKFDQSITFDVFPGFFPMHKRKAQSQNSSIDKLLNLLTNLTCIQSQKYG